MVFGGYEGSVWEYALWQWWELMAVGVSVFGRVVFCHGQSVPMTLLLKIISRNSREREREREREGERERVEE